MFKEKKITGLYWLAVALTAMLVLCMHVLIEGEVARSLHNSELYLRINKMARNTQRISTFVDTVVNVESPQKRKESIGAIQDALTQIDENRVFLSRSKQAERMLNKQLLQSVLARMDEFFVRSDSFVGLLETAAPQDVIKQSPDYIYLSGHKKSIFLEDMERIIFLFRSARDKDVSDFLFMERIFVISLLAVLLLEVLFIFKPMERRIRKAMTDMEGRAQEAEDANRLKNEFLATMSHEIRSPMSGVLGMAELLMATKQSPEQNAYTKTILNSGESLLRIIEDILDVSKIEAGKLELDPVGTDMLELVDNVCALHAAKAHDKAIELAVRYVPGTERFVYADPIRVRQILSNLIDNAVKFTESGHICITVREDRRGFLQGAEKVNLVFTVEDSGIGISKEAQSKIFNKFTQADSSTTRLYGGTGLGLSISRQLVQMMKGDISLFSEPWQGTTFTFNLLLERNTEDARKLIYPTTLHGMRMLVVDDLPIIRVTVSEQVAMAGMQCDAASGAMEALEMMESACRQGDPYQIVLLDYLMGDMNGEMLACAIRENDLFKGSCLVLLTAAGNAGSMQDLMNKGFSGYIAKPVNGHVLINTLALIWDGYKNGATEIVMHTDILDTYKKGSADAANLKGARILLAEDSRVNQMFVLDVLRQIGCETKIVSNGREALAVIQEGNFDLVLMDCQMPIMDGFDAARGIKELKLKGLVKADLPIIALTANAMKGDRQRCLDAGMDDYVSKPVRTADLQQKILNLIGPATARTEKSPADSPEAFVEETGTTIEEGLFDEAALMHARRILKSQFQTTLNFFIEDSKTYISEIKTGIAARDPTMVIRPAHTMKSAALNLGAVRLSTLAKELETQSRMASESLGSWNEAQLEHTIKMLEDAFERSCEVLNERARAA